MCLVGPEHGSAILTLGYNFNLSPDDSNGQLYVGDTACQEGHLLTCQLPGEISDNEGDLGGDPIWPRERGSAQEDASQLGGLCNRWGKGPSLETAKVDNRLRRELWA